MLSSPQPSRLGALLVLLALDLLLFLPSVAQAADALLASNGPPSVPYELVDPQPELTYNPKFALFDRSIIGRAPPGVTALTKNEPMALNLQPGSTACFMVERSLLLGNDGDSAANRPSQNAQASPKSLYLSANTCLQPAHKASDSKILTPPQLVLSVSNSSQVACQQQTLEPKESQGRVFTEGAVVYGLNATGDVFIGVTAPNVSTDFAGVYNFELAASVDGYFHRYENRTGAQVLWMDSDSTSALLVTRNLTENKGDVQRIMDQDPPFGLFIIRKDAPTSAGLMHSVCGLRNTALIQGNHLSNSLLNSPMTTAMTLRGPGGFPKQQFHLVGLNASTPYIGVPVRESSNSGLGKRQAGNVGAGSVVFSATEFQTVSGTNCKMVTDLKFCDEIQYAVPGNDNKFNNTALARAYDDYARKVYDNFDKAMMQIPCETPSTSRYSLTRTCDDCKAAYKKWLCTIVMPRCEDFRSGNEFAMVRNVWQPFPNGTRLPDEEKNRLGQRPWMNASRTRFVDDEIEPGPYKEILPCEDICYEVVQSCPANLQFTCPQPGMLSFNHSYGQRDVNGSTVSCNYPGEARTRMSGAAALLPDLIRLGAISLFATAVLTVR
ncbi:hypothetical protein CDD83_5772 [Cordyceps sp. RAO-2017]|nr:hypothetical protein CDD83_5772 [Cordyceps sp. RAO-2017]